MISMRQVGDRLVIGSSKVYVISNLHSLNLKVMRITAACPVAESTRKTLQAQQSSTPQSDYCGKYNAERGPLGYIAKKIAYNASPSTQLMLVHYWLSQVNAT